MTPPTSNDWPEVREWRKSERLRLLALRAGMGQEARGAAAARILPLVHAAIREHKAQAVGLYWPIKSELDFRMLAELLNQEGIATALPVILEKGTPLAYWQWSPGEPLERGFWNIPVPRQRRPIRPDAVLAPTVGFDRAGYRLGYGGGYFDPDAGTTGPPEPCHRHRTRSRPAGHDPAAAARHPTGPSHYRAWPRTAPGYIRMITSSLAKDGSESPAVTPTTGAVSNSRQSLAKFCSAWASCQ